MSLNLPTVGIVGTALVLSMVVSLGCLEQCPDYELVIEKLDPADIANETRENAVLVDKNEAEDRVSFLVDALQVAEQEGLTSLGGCEAEAARNYFDEIGADDEIEFEGTYFEVWLAVP